MTENEISTIVVDAAIAVHRVLGPGLLESVYEVILAHELRRRGLAVERQVPIAIEYDGVKFDEGFRADIIINGMVVLELKSIERTTPAHRKADSNVSPFERSQTRISSELRRSPDEGRHHQSRERP